MFGRSRREQAEAASPLKPASSAGGGKHFRPYRTPAVFFRGRNFFISFFLPNFGEHPTRNEMETLRKVIRFYVEGFREMTVGRTLWAVILVKLFIMFFILRLFFFPNYLNTPAVGGDKEEYVGRELIHRAIGDPP